MGWQAAKILRSIKVPTFRVLHKDQQPPSRPVAEDSSSAGAEDEAYLRYLQPSHNEMEKRVEYDVDEEDEDWLAQHAKVWSHVCTRRDGDLHTPGV